jgi:SAM-dependent methyltransferase
MIADARSAYDSLAPYYDAFTAHHRYDLWLADIERLARAAGLRGRRLLDVGCGTGKSFLPLLEQGWQVTACDLSGAMLERAREKAGDRARLERLDMRSLPVLGAFDLVLCLDDALNHLDDIDELTATFAGLRRNLAPGGVAVFDVTSLASYREFFASISVIPGEELVLIWEGLSGPELAPGGRAVGSITAYAREGAWWRRDAHRQEQRHHPTEAIRDALSAAGLAVAGLYGMQVDGSIEEGFDDLGNSKALWVVTAGSAP